MTITEQIRIKSTDFGFDKCGFAKVVPLEDERKILRAYLQKGYHGKMQYLENHFEKRTDPSILVPNAKTVISLLVNYFPSQHQNPEIPQIAKYAYGRDYHKVIKKNLKHFYAWMTESFGCEGRYFVDSAPVLERAWAMRAGLGWIGKNGCLINREIGSFCFIAEVIVDLPLDYDKPEFNRCGTCQRCLDDCPTKALVAPHVLDGSKCISYYTIEDKSETIEPDPNLSNRIFGCDICQDVCPWNKKCKPNNVADFMPKAERLTVDKDMWEHMDEQQYQDLFFGSAVKRASFQMLKRNFKKL